MDEETAAAIAAAAAAAIPSPPKSATPANHYGTNAFLISTLPGSGFDPADIVVMKGLGAAPGIRRGSEPLSSAAPAAIPPSPGMLSGSALTAALSTDIQAAIRALQEKMRSGAVASTSMAAGGGDCSVPATRFLPPGVANTAAAYAAAAATAAGVNITSAPAPSKPRAVDDEEDEDEPGGIKRESRQQLLERFASASRLQIGAPKVFKKERAPAPPPPVYDESTAAEALPSAHATVPLDPVVAAAEEYAASLGGGKPCGASAYDALMEEPSFDELEELELAMDAPAQSPKSEHAGESMSAPPPPPPPPRGRGGVAPPPSEWPVSLKRWVERCFLMCRTSIERTRMQVQVKEVIDDAAAEGEVFTREWEQAPVPSRDTNKDRRRVQAARGVHAVEIPKQRRSPSPEARKRADHGRERERGRPGERGRPEDRGRPDDRRRRDRSPDRRREREFDRKRDRERDRDFDRGRDKRRAPPDRRRH